MIQKTKRWHKTSFVAIKFDGLESELDNLRNYIRTMGLALRVEQGQWDKYIDEQKASMTTDEFAEYLDFQSDNYWDLNDRFPRLMRETTFVGVMSLLEHEFVGLCHLIKRQRNITAAYEKLPRKTTLESIREYIKQHTGVDIGVQPRWKTLDTLNTIRNSIVHEDGRIRHKQSQVNNYASRNRNLIGISGRKKFPRNRVELKDGFLEHVLDILSNYCRAVHKRLRILKI